MRHAKRLSIAALALVPTLIGVSLLGIDSASGDSTAPFASLPDSATLGTSILAHGQVDNDSGQPLAGVKVVLEALPSSDSLTALPIAGYLYNTLLSTATSDSSGNYAVRLPSTSSIFGNANSTGLIDFLIMPADPASTLMPSSFS